MSYVDQEYADLLHDIIYHGSEIQSRNSITKRFTGIRMRFTSTPLISIRKTAWKNALREMEWFLSGSSNINDLHPSVRSWWEPFCKVDSQNLIYNYGHILRKLSVKTSSTIEDYKPNLSLKDEKYDLYHREPLAVIPDGAKYTGQKLVNSQGDEFTVIKKIDPLSDVYLIQFKSNGFLTNSKATNFKRGVVKNPYYPSVVNIGCYGSVDKTKFSYYKKAYQIWCGMINRCYNSKRKNYKYYGAKGIFVSKEWKCFENFINDVSKIQGFEEWLLTPNLYHLDKDWKKANYYGVDTCVFLKGNENIALANAERFYSVPRTKRTLDQVEELINGLKDDPFSRRNLISTWNIEHVVSGLMNPMNCHGTVIHAFVEPNNKLEILMYQRSCDMLLGVPHNWIQYWAFLLWLAKETDREPGAFTWIGGDCHLYENHLDVAKAIIPLSQEPIETPTLIYNGAKGAPFKANNFVLDVVYKPLSNLSAKMVV